MSDTAQVPATNKEIQFKVQLNQKDEADDIYSFYISVDDSGSYTPYYVQEHRGQLMVWVDSSPGQAVVRELRPSTLRDLLKMIADDTPHRRSERALSSAIKEAR